MTFGSLFAGLEQGQRSSLWFEMLRIVCEIRPRFVLIENVQGLFQRGFDLVLKGLAVHGYDAEWTTVHAAEAGAHHKRGRVFILAYSASQRLAEGTLFYGNAVVPQIAEAIGRAILSNL